MSPAPIRARRVASPFVALLVLAATVVVGCASSTASAPAGGIIRESLGSTITPAAPGYQLGLWHYTIPAGSKLTPHHHPGWQVAHITAGTLSYTVISGTATVIRKGGATESYGPGKITLAAGDTVVESPEMQHFGANETNAPVEIESSTLFVDGSAPAIALTEASGATAYTLDFLGTSDPADLTFHTAGADGSLTYGTGRIGGTATLGDTPVTVEILAALAYTSGNGPFTGYVTVTLPSGDALAFSYVGVATSDGGKSTIAGAMRVIGGSGALSGVTGTGTLGGTREGPVGSPVRYDMELSLVGMPR